jgi:hypothetical protein
MNEEMNIDKTVEHYTIIIGKFYRKFNPITLKTGCPYRIARPAAFTGIDSNGGLYGGAVDQNRVLAQPANTRFFVFCIRVD